MIFLEIPGRRIFLWYTGKLVPGQSAVGKGVAMETVTRMAKTRKPDVASAEPPAPNQASGVKEKKEPVKLRLSFKEKLQLIANDAKLDMGELIERELATFVEREYRRVLEKKLAEIQAKSDKRG